MPIFLPKLSGRLVREPYDPETKLGKQLLLIGMRFIGTGGFLGYFLGELLSEVFGHEFSLAFIAVFSTVLAFGLTHHVTHHLIYGSWSLSETKYQLIDLGGVSTNWEFRNELRPGRCLDSPSRTYPLRRDQAYRD
jgi:hypothetical protein